MADPCFTVIVKCPEHVVEFWNKSFFFCFLVLDPVSILAVTFSIVIYAKASTLPCCAVVWVVQS